MNITRTSRTAAASDNGVTSTTECHFRVSQGWSPPKLHWGAYNHKTLLWFKIKTCVYTIHYRINYIYTRLGVV